ncbi:CHAT domain-containing protein [Erythrobacter sp. NFXS35]|uniref:CHAT domain-containing tetratricopeptide repeat protein n=1 Tax=Erythrobacter sp. NFXS35 TaxID=2818436 RepID=UPI0032E020B2
MPFPFWAAALPSALWLGILAAPAALAQDIPAAATGTEQAAIIAEIEAFGTGDASADPAADLVKIADLRRRIAAHGGLPATELGLLESAEGAAHFYLRDFDAAAAAYGRAGPLLEAGGAPPDELAGFYNNRASILAAIGRYAEAEADHRRALAIRRGIEGERGEAVSSSLFGLGYVYYRQGRIEESLPFLREAAEQQLDFVRTGNPLPIVRMTSLASVLGRSGRTAEGLAAARKAEALAREYLGPDHPTFGIALNNLGNALIENRIFREAIPVLRESMAVRIATVGERASGTAITMRNLATALKASGQQADAEELNRRALEIYEGTGEVETPFALAYLYAELADFAARRGEWDRYFALSDKSLESADAALEQDSAEQAHIHLYRAEWLLRKGDLAAARAEAERWVPVMQSDLIAAHEDRIWAEMLLARLRQLTGEDAASVTTLADAAMDKLESKLADLAVSDGALVREAQRHREAAILYLALAADLADEERMVRSMQLANISELARGQQFAQPADGGGEDGALALRARLLDLARTTAELRARLEAAQLDESADRDALARQLTAADSAADAIEARLLREHPEFVARCRPQPLTLARLRARMQDGDLLLAPIEGEARTWVLAIDKDSLRWTTLDTAQLGKQVAALREAVDLPDPALASFPLGTAHALFRDLLPHGLGNARRVLVHGGERLASLPVALLTTRAHDGPLADAPWLVRTASVQVLSNLALFKPEQPVRAPQRSRRFVGVGGVELPAASADNAPRLAGLFRSGRPDRGVIVNLPALPAAAQELRGLAEAFPTEGRMLLIGPDAAEERFKGADLTRLDVLAFATHGMVAGEMTGLWEPALLLGTSDPSAGEDGLLGASEIARLTIDADWVILSACNTASGASDGAPSYSGLATAFAQSGARALLLSHWRVRDDAAAWLSVRTLEAVNGGESRAGALRQAQLALIGDSGMEGASHPAIWAPFVLIEN